MAIYSIISQQYLTITLHAVHSDFTYNYYDIGSCSFRIEILKGGPLLEGVMVWPKFYS